MRILHVVKMAIGYAVSAALLAAVLWHVPWSTVATTLGLGEPARHGIPVATSPAAPVPRAIGPEAAPTQPSRPATPPDASAPPSRDGGGTEAPEGQPSKPWRGRLHVAAWERDFKVKDISMRDDGALVPPDDIATLGRWDRGAIPGSGTGTVVLVVHRDSNVQGQGAFAELENLPKGARVTIGGQTYRLEQLTTYTKSDSLPSEKLFGQGGPERLVIVTCGGTFTHTSLGWDSNVVGTFRLDAA